MAKIIDIPAGFPWSAFVSLSRALPDSTQYTDITDASDVPSSNWAICFVAIGKNLVDVFIPIDWDTMTDEGKVEISLTAEQTLQMAGNRYNIMIRNDAGTSDFVSPPEDIFCVIPNGLYNL